MTTSMGGGRQGGKALPIQTGPGPRGTGSSRNVMVALVLVVVLVAVAALVQRLTNPGGGDPLLWSLDGRTIAAGGSVRPTTWTTGPIVAITRAREVTGYDAATGRTVWTVPLPGGVCAASARPAGSRVALQYGRGSGSETAGRPGQCDRVAVLDLEAGTKVWERRIGADRTGRGQVVIAAGAVVVEYLYGTSAFGLTDGRPLWQADDTETDCSYEGLAGGRELLAGRSCRGGDRIDRVHRLDPVSGRALWTYKVPAGYTVASLPSSRPAVIGLRPTDRGSELPWLFVALDASGRRTAALETDRFAVNCSVAGRDLTRCTNVVVTDDTLYVRQSPGPDADAAGTAPVVALDLATGRIRWTTDNPDGNHLFPIAMDGSRLIAAQPRTAGKGGRRPRLVAIDAATGRIRIMWSLGNKADFWLRSSAHRTYSAGRLFLTKSLVTGKEEVAFRAYGDRSADDGSPAHAATAANTTATPEATPKPTW